MIILFCTNGFFLNEKGKIFFQYKTTTAMIAPNCITTKNISLNAGDIFSCKNSSTNIICPVLLTGSHSVIPSIIPKIMAFIISINSIIHLSLFFIYFSIFTLKYPARNRIFHFLIKSNLFNIYSITLKYIIFITNN